MIKDVLFDVSGVFYTGNETLPGALDSIQKLNDANIHVRYLTNTTSSTRAAILAKTAAIGLQINADKLFTGSVAAYNYLSRNNLTGLSRSRSGFCQFGGR